MIDYTFKHHLMKIIHLKIFSNIEIRNIFPIKTFLLICINVKSESYSIFCFHTHSFHTIFIDMFPSKVPFPPHTINVIKIREYEFMNRYENLTYLFFFWCCIIKVDIPFSRILIYNHNQYEKEKTLCQRKTNLMIMNSNRKL